MAPPNIVWITLDSLRSDHTALDGYERDTTPNLSRLGKSGYGFAECISHSKATLLSSGAILTGYAPTHTTLGISGNVLPEGVRTIPERFSAAGYDTACLSRNSFVSSATGLDRGFDRFQWLASSTIKQAGLGTLLKYLWNIRTHSAGLRLDTAKHASPLLMNETAKGWLDDFSKSSDPFFFYFHYNEPHRPYYPPNSYLAEYTDSLSMSSREAAEFALDVHYNLHEIVANGCELTDEEWGALHAMYDAEIAYTDEMVGRLVDHVHSLDIGETIVVVTADHGELFGEHGLLSHRGVLSDAVTRVPLVFCSLGGELDLRAAENNIIQHADIMQTLMMRAGIDPKDTMGVDLRDTTREFAVSQRQPLDFDSILEHNPEFDMSRFLDGTVTAVRTEEYRYQKSEEGTELFELEDETRDVSADFPDVAARLEDDLDEWLKAHGRPVAESENVEFSGSVQQQLEDLGYRV